MRRVKKTISGTAGSNERVRIIGRTECAPRPDHGKASRTASPVSRSNSNRLLSSVQGDPYNSRLTLLAGVWPRLLGYPSSFIGKYIALFSPIWSQQRPFPRFDIGATSVVSGGYRRRRDQQCMVSASANRLLAEQWVNQSIGDSENWSWNGGKTLG